MSHALAEVEATLEIHQYGRDEKGDDSECALSIESGEHNAAFFLFLVESTDGKYCGACGKQIVCQWCAGYPYHCTNDYQYFTGTRHVTKYFFLIHLRLLPCPQ